MKKIFTLFATIMMAVCANAGEVELWSGSATVNAWENAPIFLSDTGTELKNAGALPGDFVRFYATAENPNWQIQVVEGHWGPVYAVYAATELTNEDGSPVNNVVVDLNTVGYIEIELTEEILEAAYTQKYWGGVFILNGDGNVEVTKVTLKTALDWNSEPVNIEFNENGFIPASAFEGYNDYAKVQFTYNVAGSLSSYQNWGIGAVQSSDGNTSVVNLPASSLGDITVGCFKKDLQPAFDATPEGLLFNVWGFGDGVCVGSRVKVEVFDVVSTGINAVRSEVENENAPIYNLAGQRVDKSYKGVVIQNGKKFIQK